MKLFIGSDIHGSEANLIRFFQAVDESLAGDQDTKVVLLGDIYNHGPRNPFPEGYAPMKVAKLLNDAMTFITVIKGNCDSEVDQMISNFPIISDFSMRWGEHTVYFTHGHKCNPELPPTGAKSGDLVFYGHFHRSAVTEKDGVKYVCVGALGLNPEGAERSYAVLEENRLTVLTLMDKKVLFDIEI